eukprot:scaffold25883_cov134-Skeletonema_marinoi.AAC.6
MAGARVDRSSAGQSYCPRERSAHDLSEDGLMHMSNVDVEAGVLLSKYSSLSPPDHHGTNLSTAQQQ